jgi:hypothetical protein
VVHRLETITHCGGTPDLRIWWVWWTKVPNYLCSAVQCSKQHGSSSSSSKVNMMYNINNNDPMFDLPPRLCPRNFKGLMTNLFLPHPGSNFQFQGVINPCSHIIIISFFCGKIWIL